MEAPRHVLLVLDDEGDLHSVGEESDGEALGGETPELSDDGRADAMSQEQWRPRRARLRRRRPSSGA